MIIKLNPAQKIEEISSPLKEIIQKRHEEFKLKYNRRDQLVDVCSFEWRDSPEYLLERYFWSRIYNGEEVIVPEGILKLWESEGLFKQKIEIESISKGVYFANSKYKKYKITIEEIL